MAQLNFNEQFYLQQNPDVVAAIARGQFANAQQHFNQFGAFEGRDPNVFFDTSFYLSQYPDVLNARANPLDHFINFGAAEFRFANATADSAIDTDGNNFANEFNAQAYLAANPDLANAVGAGRAFENAYEHYVLFGQFESRPGTPFGGPFTNTGNAPGTGQTFTLTNNLDSLTGTAGNDTFVGDLATTSAADSINGGAGNDTLNLFGLGAAPAIPQLNSVENLNFVSPTAALTNVDVSAIAGLQTVGLVNSAVGSTFTVNANQNVAYTGLTGAGGQNVITTGVDTALTVNLNNSTTGAVDVQGAGLTTLNVVAGGTGRSTIASLGSTTGVETTVNLSGNQGLTITGALADSVTTVNASSNTGGVNVALGNSVATVTGGSGNDVFNFGGGLTATVAAVPATATTPATAAVQGDVVNGGAGFDTVRVSSAVASDFSTAANAAAFNQLVSIERVGFDTTAGGVGGVTLNGATFTNTGITNIEFNTVGADTVNGAGSARTYEFGTANAGDAAFNMSAGATTLNLDLRGTAGATAVNGDANTVEVGTLAVTPAGAVSATNVTSITLSSLGNFTAGTLANVAMGGANTVGLTAGTFNSVATITAASGSTLTLDGNAALDIGASTNNIIVNASAMTGSLVIQGSSFVGNQGTVVAAGGAGAATTTTQTGVDTITLGSARDVVQFAADGLSSGIIEITGSAAAGTVATGNVFVDVINGFTAGANGDILDIAGAAATYTATSVATQNAINALSGANATLLGAANAAADGNSAAGWTAFSFQGQTYALYEGAADTVGGFENTDTLVRLAGVNIAELTAANFA